MVQAHVSIPTRHLSKTKRKFKVLANHKVKSLVIPHESDYITMQFTYQYMSNEFSYASLYKTRNPAVKELALVMLMLSKPCSGNEVNAILALFWE